MTTATATRHTPTRGQIDYTLREWLGRTYAPEAEPILYCDVREIVVAGGERAGKSFTMADWELARCWWGKVTWLCGDDYSTPQQEFNYIADGLTRLGLSPDVKWHESDMSTIRYAIQDEHGDIQEHIIKTKSLLKWLKIAQEAPDRVLLSEAGRCFYSQYQRLLDRTAERRGTMFASGTFESSLGWYPEKWKQGQVPGGDCVSFSLPSWSNLHVYPGGREDPEIQRLERVHPKDYFMERFGGVPSPPHGLVFREFRNLLHVREIKIVDAPIYLAIDPGYAGAYAVEFVQVVNDQVRVVAEIYERGLVSEEIIDLCLHKPWWKLVKGGVVDIAAKQHQAMPAVVEVWRAKTGLALAMNKVEEAEGRERMHSFLKPNPITGEPGMILDQNCTGAISEFGGCPSPFRDLHGEKVYTPYKWKESAQGEVVGMSPEDKNNHAIKALTYFLIDRFGFVRRKQQLTTVSTSPFA